MTRPVIYCESVTCFAIANQTEDECEPKGPEEKKESMSSNFAICFEIL